MKKNTDSEGLTPIQAAGGVIDYKDIPLLKNYITKFNKIVPRYYNGLTLKEQKRIARAIKQARYMALIPYVLEFRK